MARLSDFLDDQSGAVTVDWVVLAAAVVGIALVVMPFIEPAIRGLSSDIAVEVNKGTTLMQAASAARDAVTP
jgi:Flp pilus assembly pilin Flp